MKILVYPRDSNPYQELLYSQLRQKVTIKYFPHVSESYFVSLLFLPFQALVYRFFGFEIFHLHWVYTFRPRTKSWLSDTWIIKFYMTISFYFFIFLLKLFKYKLIWTAHDIVPQYKYFLDNTSVIKFLSAMSDSIIVHSKSTCVDLQGIDVDQSKIEVISIGNYVGVYKNSASKNFSRKKLNISENSFVFGAIGKIEKYKGIDKLISAFVSLNLKNSILLVAGVSTNNDLMSNLVNLSRNREEILLKFVHISDNDIQFYLNSLDVEVFPFEHITTSSSILLGMSFKKPIIAPKIGDVRDFPDSVGFFYNPNEPLGLLDSMKNAYNNRQATEVIGEKAFRYISHFSWESTAKKTYEVYEKVLQN